jgi:hypothetical protein
MSTLSSSERDTFISFLTEKKDRTVHEDKTLSRLLADKVSGTGGRPKKTAGGGRPKKTASGGRPKKQARQGGRVQGGNKTGRPVKTGRHGKNHSKGQVIWSPIEEFGDDCVIYTKKTLDEIVRSHAVSMLDKAIAGFDGSANNYPFPYFTTVEDYQLTQTTKYINSEGNLLPHEARTTRDGHETFAMSKFAVAGTGDEEGKATVVRGIIVLLRDVFPSLQSYAAAKGFNLYDFSFYNGGRFNMKVLLSDKDETDDNTYTGTINYLSTHQSMPEVAVGVAGGSGGDAEDEDVDEVDAETARVVKEAEELVDSIGSE